MTRKNRMVPKKKKWNIFMRLSMWKRVRIPVIMRRRRVVLKVLKGLIVRIVRIVRIVLRVQIVLRAQISRRLPIALPAPTRIKRVNTCRPTRKRAILRTSRMQASHPFSAAPSLPLQRTDLLRNRG